MIVTIIDDGVSFNAVSDLLFSLHVGENGEIKEYDCDIDTLSHGSICAGIIRKYAAYTKLGSIKILDTKTKRGDCDNLVKAIYWCIENDVKIINLSLGSVFVNDYHVLLHAVNMAYKHNIIIVSACKNGEITSYPASFSNVIGVRCDPVLRGDSYYAYEINYGGIDFFASSSHEIDILSAAPYQITPICNSYAAPLITAKVYSILVKHPQLDIDGIKDKLNKLSDMCIHTYKPNIYKSIDWVDGVDVLVFGDMPFNKMYKKNWNIDKIININSLDFIPNETYISRNKAIAIYYSTTIKKNYLNPLKCKCLIFLNKLNYEYMGKCDNRIFIPTLIDDYFTDEIISYEQPVVAIIQNMFKLDYLIYVVIRDMLMQKGFKVQLFSEHGIDILVGAVFVNNINQYKYNCINMVEKLGFDFYITHTTIESIVGINGFRPDIIICSSDDIKKMSKEIIKQVQVIETDNYNVTELFQTLCNLICE